MEVLITNGYYKSKSLPLAYQQCVNWYPSVSQTRGALSQENLFGTPGITLLTTSGTVQQANRGSLVKDGIPYAVNGDKLYSLVKTVVSGEDVFTMTALGTISGSGRVSMASNGTQLMILVPGGKGYVYNEAAGTPFAEITDSDFTANGAPQYVVFIDGYFACTTDSKKWIVSDLNNALSWNALDFGTAESNPDSVVAPIINNNQAYITGTETTEGFQNVGGSGFSFTRTGVFLQKGCKSPFALIISNKTFFMIGAGKDEGPAIWVFDGNDFQRVSTIAIEKQLGTYTVAELQAAFALSYSEDGAYFVAFTFSDTTFVYDQTSKRWHERNSTISDVQSPWRVNSLVTAYGRIIVFDSVDGRVGELSTSVYTEYGETIIRIVTPQVLANGGKEVSFGCAELTMESGVGNSDCEDPVVGQAISRDGRTFGNERLRKIGKIGEYNKRQIWHKNGSASRYMILRYRLSDPVKPVIIKLEIN